MSLGGFPLWCSVWGVMGAYLSMRSQTRSSGLFYSGILSRNQYSRVSLRMLFAMDSEARTGSNVSRSHVVLLIIYLSSGDKNSKTESPCYL